ncbi:hypothetical protein Q5P01_025762 [Channa striata]|uniref:rRNA biogenesis protein RRP36 n=1 Tax=Channa striata TaxID=64152 RepID=A0AA88IQ54_CHASR|nr:hypothetical protein Q5P01_025762 [Channa striata]
MKVKEKRQGKQMVSKKMTAASSRDDEDSDVEKNFTLLTERQAAGGWAEEEDEVSEEEEEGSDAGEEEESDGSGGESDVGEEDEEVEGDEKEEEGDDSKDSEEEDEDDDDDDDDDEDLEDVGGSSGLQTREDIQKELSSMSFEDIMKLQSKVGTKVYNEVAYGSNKSREISRTKRLNKNRPMEISAKKPAPFLRHVVPVRKPTLRDPRFDDLSGEFKPEIFEKTFKFIDDIRHREKEIVKKQLKRVKNSNTRMERLQFLLKRMENQERARLSREQQRERELQFKRQQRERANQGARPFFLKKSEKKKLQLAEKYQELRKSGKLENFLSKKRKRNAVKDRRKLPK